MEVDHNYLVDHVNKVLLKAGAPIPAPAGCPTTLLFATEYDNLLLAKPGVKWPKMKDDVDIATFIKARDDYITFEFEKRIESRRPAGMGRRDDPAGRRHRANKSPDDHHR